MEGNKSRFVQPTWHINKPETKVPNKALQSRDPDPKFRAIP